MSFRGSLFNVHSSPLSRSGRSLAAAIGDCGAARSGRRRDCLDDEIRERKVPNVSGKEDGAMDLCRCTDQRVRKGQGYTCLSVLVAPCPGTLGNAPRRGQVVETAEECL